LDFEIVDKLELSNPIFDTKEKKINLVYIGRGGHDMTYSLKGIFTALKQGKQEANDIYSKIRMYFIGTSYAADGKGVKTIEPIAAEYGVEDQVTEITNRLPYFEAIHILKQSDILIVPGSNDSQYTASKLYPYLLANKPLLAAFHKNSSVVRILKETNAGEIVIFDENTNPEEFASRIFSKLDFLIRNLPFSPSTNWPAFEPYTAEEMTRKQVKMFNKITAA